MRKVLIGMVVMSVIALASCHKPQNTQGSLTLKINPMFGSNNFALQQYFTTPDGKYYNFFEYKFYLSHIKLIHSDGSMVEVAPVAYFSSDDSRTWNISLTNILGNYTGIQFNIGLDPAQDTTIGNTTDSTSPFWANNFTYWGTSALEYVFVAVSGNLDTMVNQPTTFPFIYHIGTQPFYSVGNTLTKNFSTSLNSQTVLTMNADLEKVFYNAADTGVINVIKYPVTHSTDSVTLAHTFISYFPKVFSLQ